MSHTFETAGASIEHVSIAKRAHGYIIFYRLFLFPIQKFSFVLTRRSRPGLRRRMVRINESRLEICRSRRSIDNGDQRNRGSPPSEDEISVSRCGRRWPDNLPPLNFAAASLGRETSRVLRLIRRCNLSASAAISRNLGIDGAGTRSISNILSPSPPFLSSVSVFLPFSARSVNGRCAPSRPAHRSELNESRRRVNRVCVRLEFAFLV